MDPGLRRGDRGGGVGGYSTFTSISLPSSRNFFDISAMPASASTAPAPPSAAFGLGEKSGDPVQMYLNDIFTVTANLAGLPGLSLPAALDASGLPLGLQVIGRALDEETVFSVSAALEKAAAFGAKPTAWW